MLLIGGVVGALFYLKGHLPPPIQEYLGGVLTKTSSGVEYEMVPMAERGGGGGVGGVNSGSSGAVGGYSDAKVMAQVEAKKNSFIATESQEDWGEDDGWGDEEEGGWGDEDDMETVPLGGGKSKGSSSRVLPRSEDERRHSDRFNSNR